MRSPYSDYFEKQKTTFLRKMLGTQCGSVGTRFSLILETRWCFSLILGTRIGSLKRLKKPDTREAHTANYTNRLKLQTCVTHTSRYMSISGQRQMKSIFVMHWAVNQNDSRLLYNNWSQRTHPAWTRATLQTVNILLHWIYVALAIVQP